jgi:ATP-binding cassette, subfamily G (WHITE), member 2, SNQ2
VFYSKIWLDFGITWIFCIFNFLVVFLCSWLYLGGLKQIKAALKPKRKGDRIIEHEKV